MTQRPRPANLEALAELALRPRGRPLLGVECLATRERLVELQPPSSAPS